MTKPDLVIAGVWRSLKQGGRFVGEFGGYGNVAKITAALSAVLAKYGIDPKTIDPWYFPTVEDYRSRLEAKGFRVDRIALIPRPTPLPTDIRGWLLTFANPFASKIANTERNSFLDEVVSLLKPDLCDSDDRWFVDYVRLRFAAIKL
jgi:hypothetical protein